MSLGCSAHSGRTPGPARRAGALFGTSVLLTGLVLPATVNDREYANSYVCSPYTGTISYPLEELAKLKSRSLRAALRVLIHGMAPLRMKLTGKRFSNRNT